MSVLWDGPVLLDSDGGEAHVTLRMKMSSVLDGIISEINSRTTR